AIMPDTLRGAAAIVGIGELKPERTRPGRDAMSLLAEAAYLAIQDAGLTKRDIDGMVVDEAWARPGPATARRWPSTWASSRPGRPAATPRAPRLSSWRSRPPLTSTPAWRR